MNPAYTHYRPIGGGAAQRQMRAEMLAASTGGVVEVEHKDGGYVTYLVKVEHDPKGWEDR